MATLKLSRFFRVTQIYNCQLVSQRYASETVSSGDKAKPTQAPQPAAVKKDAAERFAAGQSDNTQYKTGQYYGHNPYTYYDLEIEMLKDRNVAPNKKVAWTTPKTKQ